MRYAAVFLSPFVNLRTDAIYFTLSDGLFFVVLCMLLAQGKIPRNPLGVMTLFWCAAFLLVAGGLHVSSLYAGDPVRGIILSCQYFFCFILLPYALMQSDLEEGYRLLIVFVLAVIALDAHGIFTYYSAGYSPESKTVTGAVRLATLNGNPNGAACLNAMALVFVMWLRSVRRISLKIALPFIGIIMLTIILTSSNTGLIAVSVGVLCFLVTTFHWKLLFHLLLSGFVAAMFLYHGGDQYLPPTFQKRVLQAVVAGDISDAGTFVSRQELNMEALEMIGNLGPIPLGIGSDQFRLVSVQHTPVHNTLLMLWVEGGIFSVAGWVLLLFLGPILWLLAKRRGEAADERAPLIASFAVFTIVSNASTHIYTRFWFATLLLVMQPAIIALAMSSSRRRSRFERPGVWLPDPECTNVMASQNHEGKTLRHF